MGEDLVDGLVVVGGVVVEQRQAARAGLGRHVHGVVDRAVAPGGLRRELVDGVLRVVDQQVGAVAEVEHGVGDRVAVGGHLVVGQVGDRGAAHLDPVAVGEPDVGHRAHLHLGAVELEVLVPHVVEADVAEQLLGGDREERRPHELAERGAEAAGVVLGRAVHVEAGAGLEHRREERQALHVVPVDVGDQRRAREGLARDRASRPRSAGRCRGRGRSARGPATPARRTTCCRRSGGWRRTGTGSNPGRRRS